MAPGDTITANGQPDHGALASPIRVMIVDDSLVVRSVLARIIEPEPDLAIVARTGSAEVALTELARHPADVVLLDLEMPGMGGLDALPRILAASSGTQVLVVSSLTDTGAEHTLAALSMGAADTMLKPRSGEFDEYYRSALLNRVRALGRHNRGGASIAPPTPAVPPPRVSGRAPDLIGIGASTGGIHALCVLLRSLPRSVAVPIVVTQHLPGTFMQVFARQLELASGREAVVTDHRTPVLAGRIHVAPGDAHMVLRKEGARLIAGTASYKVPSGCTPSVDPMFESMAQTVAGGGLGIVLSGMGRDGENGAHALVRSGGMIIAQDQSSSSVWGMPRAVAEAGLASAVLPPEAIAIRIGALAEQGGTR